MGTHSCNGHTPVWRQQPAPCFGHMQPFPFRAAQHPHKPHACTCVAVPGSACTCTHTHRPHPTNKRTPPPFARPLLVHELRICPCCRPTRPSIKKGTQICAFQQPPHASWDRGALGEVGGRLCWLPQPQHALTQLILWDPPKSRHPPIAHDALIASAFSKQPATAWQRCRRGGKKRDKTWWQPAGTPPWRRPPSSFW